MTREWFVDPRLLCDNHLAGEHSEIHQIVGYLRSGHLRKIVGHAVRGQLSTATLQGRHRLLVAEMDRRGWDHDSPLDYEDTLDLGRVRPHTCRAHRAELARRCGNCRALMQEAVDR